VGVDVLDDGVLVAVQRVDVAVQLQKMRGDFVLEIIEFGNLFD
jgi:hypothetical protein